jgi:hypothetical protein
VSWSFPEAERMDFRSKCMGWGRAKVEGGGLLEGGGFEDGGFEGLMGG